MTTGLKAIGRIMPLAGDYKKKIKNKINVLIEFSSYQQDFHWQKTCIQPFIV